MLLVDLTQKILDLFPDLAYLGPFFGLLLCGLGLPLPEEAFLLGAGLLLHAGKVEFVPITLVCSFAILLGDSLPFFLGKRYGMRALEIGWVRRTVHPERFQRFRKRFDDHGNWATFCCRFLPMLRIPGYFIAGTMGMRYTRLLLLDGLGVLLSVPISIYLGKLFGGQIERLKEEVRDLHLILGFLVFVLVLVIVIRARWNRSNSGSGAPPPPPEG